MVVRIRLSGKGTPENRYGFPLPTYTSKLQLHDQGIGYATISEDDHPNLAEHPSAKFEASDAGPILVALDSDGHAKWHAHLDDRYKEHKGKFRPEIA